MILSPDLRSHPLKFLLRLEWILLLLLVLMEILAIEVEQLSQKPGLNAVGLAIFFLLGLRLPERFSLKLLYLILEIGLVLLLTLVGGVRLFQLLFVAIVMRNCILFEGALSLAVTSALYLLYAIAQFHRFTYVFPFKERIVVAWLSFVLVFGLMVIFLQMLVRVVLSERRGREKLAIANKRLRQYALKIEDRVTLQERNRIAREIHDSLGHSLTVYNLHIETVSRLFETDPTEAKALLSEAKQFGSQALRDVRQSVSTLRSGSIAIR